MYWRLSRSEFEQNKGSSNRHALETLVRSGSVPGIIAYVDSQPAGWCAIAPRDEYQTLARSRILKPVDGRPVWSITCFFIHRTQRRRGLSVRLIRAAVEYAFSRGADCVEAYPVEPRSGNMPAAFAWTGISSAFIAAGFQEAARRSETRPIMRIEKSDTTEMQ